MKKLASLCVATVILVVGCATKKVDETPVSGDGLTDAPQPTPEATTSGSPKNTTGELGQMYDAIDQETDGTFTYIIHSITVDQPCEESPVTQDPEHGHFIGLQVSMSAGEMNPSSPWVDFNASQEIELTDPNGKLQKKPFSYAAFVCEGSQQFLGNLEQGQSVDFLVVLDTEYTTGVVTYQGRRFTF